MNAVISPERTVSVKTYGRLHLGFFDLSDQPQRRFGSLGVAIDAYHTAVTLEARPQQTPVDPWANAIKLHHLQSLDTRQDINLRVEHAIPRHGGLGSGTQMALAIGAGINTLMGQPVNPGQIAAIHQRGARSGIGIATFAHGGLVVDGGKGDRTVIPPLLAQHPFPSAWHFLLVMDHYQDGLHGKGEKNAFKTLAPQPATATREVQHQLLMQGLPALLEQDFHAFSTFIGVLQGYNAEYFGPAQGGAYASPLVSRILDDFKQQGYQGLGQTSWGPTGFVLFPSRAEAVRAQSVLAENYAAEKRLSFVVSAAVNAPAQVQIQARQGI